MCGIAGIFLKRENKILSNNFLRMKKLLSHRGPDASGIYSTRYLKLVHTRLSIVDLETGNQPIENDRFVLIANGEIYNDLELRKKYKKFAFKSKSDSESILATYYESGLDGLKLLRGMFAFALYDKQKKILILGRDIFGIKPLYFCCTNDGISFSSELEALKKIQSSNSNISKEKVLEILQLQYSTGKHTVYSGIQRVRPGEFLVIEEGEITKSILTRFTKKTSPKRLSKKYIHNSVLESISSHLRSDVPYCLFYSGGIDSTLIMYFIHLLKIEKISAYNIIFDNHAQDDHHDELKIISRDFNIEMNQILFTENDFWNMLPFAAKNIDDPIADYAIIPTFKLAREASKNFKVALTGEGGDELFGGYGRYRSWIRKLKKKYYKGAFDRVSNFKKDYWDFELGFFQNKYFDFSDLQKYQMFDFENWLPNNLLVKLDRCLMTYGMEGRTPFLDKRLFDKLFFVHDNEKISKGFGKYFVRKFLSSNIKNYNSFSRKQGFTVPISSWIADKSSVLEKILPRVEILRGFLSKEEIISICRNVQTKKALIRPLWNMIFISIWYHMNHNDIEENGNYFEILSERN
ncbi:MAG: asparagine synthase (glutamine-hydrolyzing) [Rickettsiales bacterium]|nr:asparagine synthase (glutamine-hydrolyzing) [Rickettsiales bacterium]